MNKKILTIALAALAICGLSASAQNKDSDSRNRQTCPETTCAPTGNSDSRIRGPQNWREYAFEGVLLSVDQQSRIDAINKKFDSALNSASCASDTCACTDNSMAGCDNNRYRDGRGRKARPARSPYRKGRPNFKARSEYIAQVKEVLTPEQYTTFLENIVNMPVKRTGKKGDPRLRSAKSYSGKAQCRISHDARNSDKNANKDFKRAEKKAKSNVRKAEEAAE